MFSWNLCLLAERTRIVRHMFNQLPFSLIQLAAFRLLEMAHGTSKVKALRKAFFFPFRERHGISSRNWICWQSVKSPVPRWLDLRPNVMRSLIVFRGDDYLDLQWWRKFNLHKPSPKETFKLRKKVSCLDSMKKGTRQTQTFINIHDTFIPHNRHQWLRKKSLRRIHSTSVKLSGDRWLLDMWLKDWSLWRNQ